MGIIDQDTAVLWGRHGLHPAGHPNLFKSLKHHTFRYSKASKDRRRGQSVIYIEQPRHTKPQLSRRQAPYTAADSQHIPVIRIYNLRCRIIRHTSACRSAPSPLVFTLPWDNAVGNLPAGRTLPYSGQTGIIRIAGRDPALEKQPSLALQIFLHICMLAGSDMVSSQIGKYARRKKYPRRPLKFQRLGRHLHHHTVAAVICHFPQILLNMQGLRRRITAG